MTYLGANLPVEEIGGGRAAEGYREVLEEIGATLLGDLSSFRAALGALRT